MATAPKFASLVLAALLAGCQPPTSSSAPANSRAADEAREKRAEYAREMKQKLAELDAKCDDLQAKAAKAEGQAKIDLEKRVQEARLKHAGAAKKLDEMNAAAAEDWHKVKDGVGRAFEDLGNMFK